MVIFLNFFFFAFFETAHTKLFSRHWIKKLENSKFLLRKYLPFLGSNEKGLKDSFVFCSGPIRFQTVVFNFALFKKT